MRIEKQSCTRVDLSGGTLDCWPLHTLVGGCVTVNLAISIRTYAALEPLPGSRVHIVMHDLKYDREFPDLAALLACEDAELNLVQKQAAYWRPREGFRLETRSESPVGAGLGGSSSLSISVIKAFSEWLKFPLELQPAVELSHNLEAQVLHKMTGTQDYYPALAPGLNAIHYQMHGPKLEAISTSADFWNARLTLVYTGQPHHSGLNNWQVIKAALEHDATTLKALADIRDVSADLYSAVKAERYGTLPQLFDREFEARVRLSSSFSSPRIEKLRDVALKAGAQAVKICGAGGGGCVLVWSEPERKADVESGCRAQGFEVLNAKAVV